PRRDQAGGHGVQERDRLRLGEAVCTREGAGWDKLKNSTTAERRRLVHERRGRFCCQNSGHLRQALEPHREELARNSTLSGHVDCRSGIPCPESFCSWPASSWWRHLAPVPRRT